MRTGTERMQKGQENVNGTCTEQKCNGYGTDIEQVKNGKGNTCGTAKECVLSSIA